MGFVYAAIGGAVGACFRFAMSLWLDGGLLPWKTLATNITGSFIIGLVWGLSAVEEWFQSGGGCCWLSDCWAALQLFQHFP